MFPLEPDFKHPASGKIHGLIVYMYAFDIAYEMRRFDGEKLLGQSVAQFRVDHSKRSPKQIFFYRPQMVRLAPMEKIGPRGAIRLDWVAKLLPIGVISLTLRLPFEVDSLEELTAFHDLRFSDGRSIHDEARDLAEQLRVALQPWLIQPRPELSDEEAYTVFCVENLDQPDDFDTSKWIEREQRNVAALLTEEFDPTLLSDAECHESTNQQLSYSRRDLVVYDWDAALVIDAPGQFDEVLHVIELANLQLTALEAYDRLLDGVVDRAYSDLNQRAFKGFGGARVQRELRTIRIDLARLTDELDNTSKFFGDWHVARLYQGLARRFHLDDWQRTIDRKLKTLGDIYQLLASDRTNRLMIFLETAIVLLFIIDIMKTLLEVFMPG